MSVRKPFYLFLFVLVLVGLISGACNMPNTDVPGDNNPNAIYTAAAQTVSAQLTQSAGAKPATDTPPAPQSPTATQQPASQPTSTNTAPVPTQTPLNTPVPTNTPVPPTATPIPIPCDRGEFVKDVSVSDGTEMSPGQEFVKTWRLKNTGTCTWNSSYSLVFTDKNSMGGPATAQLTTATVKTGETIDVSVTLKAPTTPGNYEGDWMLRNGSKVIFGIGSNADKHFWVKITVVNTVSYSFYNKAKDAEWSNGSASLDFGDQNDDTPGIAAYGTNFKLEDGKTYAKVLGTYPQRIDDGLIKGIFPAYTVKASDHFKADVGFKTSCEDASVKIQLGYMQGSSLVVLKEWRKACDGKLKSLDFDLQDLEGEKVQFVLVVLANGSPRGDNLLWIEPRIQK